MQVCPHCKGSFTRLNGHLSKSACGKKAKTIVAPPAATQVAPLAAQYAATEVAPPAAQYAATEVVNPEVAQEVVQEAEEQVQYEVKETNGYTWGHPNSKCCRDCACKTQARHHFYPNLLICRSCQDKDPAFHMITKSTAKGKYGLTDSELGGLESILVKNPVYSSAAPMTLFLEKHIQTYAEEHREEITERQLRNISRKNKAEATRKATKKRLAQERVLREEKLKAALAAIGLTRRSDSTMCDAYVNNLDNALSLEETVRLCAEMHYLYKYTSYSEELDRAVEWLRDGEGFYYPGINIDASKRAKSSILHKIRGWPAVWPWLVNQT